MDYIRLNVSRYLQRTIKAYTCLGKILLTGIRLLQHLEAGLDATSSQTEIANTNRRAYGYQSQQSELRITAGDTHA